MHKIDNSIHEIYKIYMVVALCCLLLTGGFYLFGSRPLTERLRTEHFHEISHFLESGEMLLDAVINRHISLAGQSASRTAIRKKQIAYLQGKVSREELIAFSVPKLADAMNANSEIVGIQRHGPEGRLLFSVGVKPPVNAVTACDLNTLRKIRVIGPIQVDGARRLIYCSSIIDRDAGYVGADILVMDDSDIKHIVETPQVGLGYYAIVSQGHIVYWPSKLWDSHMRDALEVCLRKGCAEQSYKHRGYSRDGYIFDSVSLKDVDWQLFSVVNKREFFSGIDRQSLILIGVLILLTVFIFILTVIALRPVIRAMLREKQLVETSSHDGLTGLYNHAYMQEYLDSEIQRAQRYGHSLSLLMFDIDYFKMVNDNYGHQTGDIVLKRISKVTSQTIRVIDTAARYGGEEFIVILPELDNHGAVTLAERLRTNIAAAKVLSTSGDEISVTMSAGVVTCDGCYDRYDKHHLITEVDKAMYASKDAGRNRITAVTLSAEV
jgi:diguanylate cyclase (GGDEF)-like protein